VKKASSLCSKRPIWGACLKDGRISQYGYFYYKTVRSAFITDANQPVQRASKQEEYLFAVPKNSKNATALRLLSPIKVFVILYQNVRNHKRF